MACLSSSHERFSSAFLPLQCGLLRFDVTRGMGDARDLGSDCLHYVGFSQILIRCKSLDCLGERSPRLGRLQILEHTVLLHALAAALAPVVIIVL